MHDYLRAIFWGLLGATIFPVLVVLAGYMVLLMACGVAILSVIGFPVAAIFFPQKLLEIVKQTYDDPEIVREIEERLTC